MSSLTAAPVSNSVEAANNSVIVFVTVFVTLFFVAASGTFCCVCVCNGSSSPGAGSSPPSNDTKKKDEKTDQEIKEKKEVQIDLQALHYYIFQSNPKYISTIELSGQYLSESEAAKRAAKENGTLLRTNNGKVYISTPGGTHAEIQFISDNQNPKTVTDLWIKNSPCASCSQSLIQYFKDCPKKPTIYIGRIWHLNDSFDDQGLIDIIEAGFTLSVWGELNALLYGSGDTTTASYLNKLKK
ncbi:PREDICTED: uncharacterized protein LOC109580384 [Amphimedon queenslandica]|uniref:CMP/dCMP-type deaminase domain-containing protein n=1 Tax=Amphimedon queenslandica TaxID=400682 RepID=A0A1X7VXW5_AMPQE|nr:PREDICTED: uncharacterized protein LOC109580384 [Amphimedon queenslandica]|eukprot:XP_019849039.1 PREDICTED: uncharacterized protein LOC109580384 [Amphimedon queenslandica]